jgi:uncharacterized protein (DUF427 family)
LRRCAERIRVVLGGVTICDAPAAWQVLETSHPPTYYMSIDDFVNGALVPAAGSSVCEWKGTARYFDVRGGGRTAERAAWSYPHPSAAFAPLADHVAVYAAAMDACYVGEEQVIPQPGGFYGGWVTSSVVGPFKGVPGSWGW